MRSTFRSLAFGLAALLGAGAIAQNMVTITGTVLPCNGVSNPVQIVIGSTDPIDTTIYTGANCEYTYVFYPDSAQGYVYVQTSCDGGTYWTGLDTTWSPLLNVLVVDLNCNSIGSCAACYTTASSQPWVIEYTNCTSGGVSPYAFMWAFSDGSISSASNPVWNIETPGLYTACLTIEDANGCTATTCDSVMVDGNGNIDPGPLNDDCYNGTLISVGSSCTPTPGDLTGATESLSPIECAGFVSYTANDVWYWFIATSTTTIVQATGDADLDVVLEVFNDSCDAPGPIDCADNTFDGGLEEITFATMPGQDYFYRIYEFTPGPSPSMLSFTTCVIGNNSVFDCEGVAGGIALPGTACTIPGTVLTGLWSANCVCVPDSGNAIDCLGFINGPNVPGVPCDDNNPLTENSVWDANCDCVPTVLAPCEADFWVMQAYTDTTGNPGGGGEPIPNVLWVWNLSSGGTGLFTFLWSFGDGTSSTDPFPTHTYANGGPYGLCLTITDNGGCTDTYCDSISVDDDGMISGMAPEGEVRATFTINVINPLTTGVIEKPELDQLATWPNPVTDELNIQLTSSLRGNVSVDILDLSGRTVLAGNRMLSNGANRLSLPTGDLNPGMYLLRIGNGGETQVLRFVKTR